MPGPRPLRTIVLAAALVGGGCTPVVAPPSSPADTLVAVDREPLPSLPEGWLGGNEDVVVEAPAADVLALLEDPESYRTVLPLVRHLELVERTASGDLLIDVVEGTGVVAGRYTARLHRSRPDRVDFAIVPERPHDVDDARGFFEVEPIDALRSRLRYHVAIDLGGVTRLLFASRVQRAAMSVAARVRDLAEQRARDVLSRSRDEGPRGWLSFSHERNEQRRTDAGVGARRVRRSPGGRRGARSSSARPWRLARVGSHAPRRRSHVPPRPGRVLERRRDANRLISAHFRRSRPRDGARVDPWLSYALQ